MQSTGKEKFTCYVYYKTKPFVEGEPDWESEEEEDEDDDEESGNENWFRLVSN